MRCTKTLTLDHAYPLKDRSTDEDMTDVFIRLTEGTLPRKITGWQKLHHDDEKVILDANYYDYKYMFDKISEWFPNLEALHLENLDTYHFGADEQFLKKYAEEHPQVKIVIKNSKMMFEHLNGIKADLCLLGVYFYSYNHLGSNDIVIESKNMLFFCCNFLFGPYKREAFVKTNFPNLAHLAVWFCVFEYDTRMLFHQADSVSLLYTRYKHMEDCDFSVMFKDEPYDFFELDALSYDLNPKNFETLKSRFMRLRVNVYYTRALKWDRRNNLTYDTTVSAFKTEYLQLYFEALIYEDHSYNGIAVQWFDMMIPTLNYEYCKMGKDLPTDELKFIKKPYQMATLRCSEEDKNKQTLKNIDIVIDDDAVANPSDRTRMVALHFDEQERVMPDIFFREGFPTDFPYEAHTFTKVLVETTKKRDVFTLKRKNTDKDETDYRKCLAQEQYFVQNLLPLYRPTMGVLFDAYCSSLN